MDSWIIKERQAQAAAPSRTHAERLSEQTSLDQFSLTLIVRQVCGVCISNIFEGMV